MASDNFNFYRELTKQNYKLLVPEENTMRVLVQLYQRERGGEFDNAGGMFTEDVILDCIRIANPTEQRIQHDKHNKIIQELLHYFLWRSNDNGHYELKTYARELCELIERRLQDQFNPTYTQKIFYALLEKLNAIWQDILESPEDFNDWVDVEFKKRQTEIQYQVEILDKKVDEAVTKIRTKVGLSDESLLDLLQSVDTDLDTITAQVDELNDVFHSSEEIRQKLGQLQNHPEQEVFGNRINEVYRFLSQNGDRLRRVRRRIDKIRPRIQRLFSDLRKREFDLKTERFFSYLLKYSIVTRDQQKKIIRLPDKIYLKQIYSEKLAFTYIKKKPFLSPKPVEIKLPAIDKVYQQNQHRHFERIHRRQKRLKHWFTKVQTVLEQHQTIIYSPLFYQILAEEVDGFSIALELAYHILSEYSRKDNYQLTIGKRAIRKDNFPQYSLYEIEVYKHHV